MDEDVCNYLSPKDSFFDIRIILPLLEYISKARTLNIKCEFCLISVLKLSYSVKPIFGERHIKKTLSIMIWKTKTRPVTSQQSPN